MPSFPPRRAGPARRPDVRGLRICFAYLARETWNELRRPDRGVLFAFTFAVLLGLWFEVSFILSFREGFTELTNIVAREAVAPRDILVALYFLLLVGFIQLLILFGFSRAQTVGIEKLRYLPLAGIQIYVVEIAGKLLVALCALLFMLPLATAMHSWLGGGAGRDLLFVVTSVAMALAMAELAVLVLLVVEGVTESGHYAFRLLFAGMVLGGYCLRFILPRESAFKALASDWTPWGIGRRIVLEGDPGAAAALAGAIVAFFFLGLAAYHRVYLGDFRVKRDDWFLDGGRLFRALGRPLALLDRDAYRLLRVDCTQMFRQALVFTIFASPVLLLLALSTDSDVLRADRWQFRACALTAFLLTSLVGLNPVGRDGRAYPLLRLLPVRRRSELLAKIALPVVVSFPVAAITALVFDWGQWQLLLPRLGALLVYAVGLGTLAAYLGIRHPSYGKIAGSPFARFPYLLAGLVLVAVAETAALVLPRLIAPLCLATLSAGVTAVLFPLALGRLERWRIEDLPGV